MATENTSRPSLYRDTLYTRGTKKGISQRRVRARARRRITPSESPPAAQTPQHRHIRALRWTALTQSTYLFNNALYNTPRLGTLAHSHTPIAARPMRTVRATSGPVFKGVCKNFSRSQGHGFLQPSHGGEDIFVHISDIEGEYVPVEGDEVTYKVSRVPPKNLKVQAVEVKIIHLNPGTKHETWSGQIMSS
uniref:CSD domain-containing protein n=1 Tax=Gasterosteus aculeatus aculeatus TaxID=481459 RepID=A0AAQ4PTU0_GASAC